MRDMLCYELANNVNRFLTKMIICFLLEIPSHYWRSKKPFGVQSKVYGGQRWWMGWWIIVNTASNEVVWSLRNLS